MRPIARAALIIMLSAVPAIGFAVGCGSDDAGEAAGTASTGALTGAGGAGSGAGGAAGTGGSTYSTTGSGPLPTTVVACQEHIYLCGDLIDNDADGLVDSQDPDCLGPCDNTEDSYYGGIPGQAGPACLVDCYFDQDSGSGNDQCNWNHKCDEHEQAPDYHPEAANGSACEYDVNANTPGTSSSCDELYETQPQFCLDFCGPLTPNGCDCFGCCELPAGGGNYVWLGSTDADGNGSCSLEDVADPTKCEPCKPVAACLNGCGTCELCIGKTELPPECSPDAGTTTSGGGGGAGGGTQCATDVQPCGLAGQSPCAAEYYCISGCCIAQPN